MKRIIPILLIKDRLLYKTNNFKNPSYVGDPIVAIKIFNEKEVDELMILDIDKSNKEPDFDFLYELAGEAFMPLSYGGGITNVNYAEKIFRSGFEKVVLNSVNQNNFEVLSEIASKFGNQAVVCAIDYKINFIGKRICLFENGRKKSKKNIFEFINESIQYGAGEILLQCVSYEGTMDKMDIPFIKDIVNISTVPVIGTGGASSHKYIKKYFQETEASALAAGSIFVYYGPHNAVLINYPNYDEKKQLLNY